MRNSTFLLLTIMLLVNTSLQAQNWVNGGNTLPANGTLGINSNQSLLFETYNTERGRITNTGLWGIGTGTTIIPNAKLHINSASTEDPFRIMVNGSTKLLVNKVGGMSIGTIGIPPANGLLVGSGFVGIGTDAPNSKVHINTIANQDPLRVMYNGSTKMLVHRGGGVAIGAAVTPPANGLHVNGNVSIGISTPTASNKLEVVSTSEWGTGIHGSGTYSGVYGNSGNVGVYGNSETGAGTIGSSTSGTGVVGYSDTGKAGYFFSYNDMGLEAMTTNPDSYAGFFDGDVFAMGVYQGSDKNLKKNIQELSNAISIINQLKPKNYQFKDEGKYASLMLPKGNHYGLLAQDVEEVLPNLVKETAHEIRNHKSLTAIKPSADGKFGLPTTKSDPKESINIKAVNYTELIPIVIKGMQEQQQTIQQLQEENNSLKERLTKLEAVLGTNGHKGNVIGAELQQNYPNPFKGITTFTYSIPKGASGRILIYDASGKLVKTLAASDAGQIQMDATGLSSGTYVYSLIVNGELIGSKQMVVAK